MEIFEIKNFNSSVNIPEELKKSICSVDSESVLMEISSAHKLNENEKNIYFELCQNRLFAFWLHSFGFMKRLETDAGISMENTKKLANDFKEKVLDKIIESLKEYNISIDPESENIYFESGKLRITDKYIDYSNSRPPQPISEVSNIECHKNTFGSNHTVYFEVFIPYEGRWGTVDRPGFVYSKQQAFNCIDKLEKAVIMGKFRLMYNNIEKHI